jgi:hyaluronan synthase
MFNMGSNTMLNSQTTQPDYRTFPLENPPPTRSQIIWKWISERWKTVTGLGISLAVIVSFLGGWTFISIPGVVAVSAYGLVSILRKAMQIIYARTYIHYARLMTRKPIIDELVAAYPGLNGAAYKLLRQPTHFEHFRQEVQRLLATIAQEQPGLYTPGADWTDARMAWIEGRWRQLVAGSFRTPSGTPPVGVVVPTYKTSQEELHQLVHSLASQSYPEIWVSIVINEINPEMEHFARSLAAHYGNGRFDVQIEPRKGKRHAMKRGFDRFLQEGNAFKYVFNIDSDSMIDLDTVANAVRLFEADLSIDCLTGDVRVSNPDVNLLTRLTYQRYFFAFNVERAAQSNFHAVTCMSGPFMGVRAAVLGQIVEDWANQHFLGQLCNFGDDRHISTLVLKHGGGSAYAPDSICWTDVPTKMDVWKRQQTRWARSAWRETLIMAPWLYKLPLWVVMDIIYLTLFPFILLGLIPALVIGALNEGVPYVAIHFAIVFALVLLFNSAYGAVIHRDRLFFLNPVYVLFQFRYLLPLRLWALVSLNKTEWGTK